MSTRHVATIRMTCPQRESIARAIETLRRSIDAADPLLSYRIAQLDLLEELLDRAHLTLEPENSNGLDRS